MTKRGIIELMFLLVEKVLTIMHKVLQLIKDSWWNMININFKSDFNQRKAIESILYLSSKVSHPDIYDICKLLYIVDKASLEKYGRFVYGETYVAMRAGTTPSDAYDLLKDARKKSIDGVRVEGNRVIPERDADLDYLSESDIECLDQTISEFGEVPYDVRKREAHDSAYEKAWGARGRKGSVSIPIESIAGLFANADDLIDYLSNRNAD